ncbi:MAG: hypothetical protein JNM03_10520 [Sphingopyxis sp.]|uniref:hypothetical protein n=1 Tax=Sphingopyxis sp. TaxID=1908224 RepID=UPI001A4A9A2D|nr:hypothetical protein [Sphingopyxis sp.]MBL9070411.1 hypothetical protein [Sphingopyxis sp.]
MAMQRVPVHADEKKIFIPVAFSEMEKPPTFTLKTPSRKQREEMQYALHEAGLRRHDDEAIREATVEELCRLWACDGDDENVQRLKRFWDAVDEYNGEAEKYLLEVAAALDAEEDAPAPFPDFAHPDHVIVDELLARLTKSSQRLRSLATDNVRFSKEFPRHAIAHALTGWTELYATPRFEEGIMQFDAVCEMQEELESRFKELGEAAFTELAAAAVNRFFLNKEAEKNSSSGPASQQTPQPTKETGSASTDGKSPVSAPSEETPAA